MELIIYINKIKTIKNTKNEYMQHQRLLYSTVFVFYKGVNNYIGVDGDRNICNLYIISNDRLVFTIDHLSHI